MSTEERVTQLEQTIAIVTKLLLTHSESMDTHVSWINQLGASQAELSASQAELSASQAELSTAQAESERRIAQLVDEQIRTGDALRALAASQQLTEEALRQFTASTKESLRRLSESQERLSESQERLAESQRRTDGKLFDTDARLDRIAEAVERMTQNGRA